MDKILEIGKLLIANWEVILGGLIAALTGLIAVAMIIPGEQPDKALQAAVDFLKRFSRKPAQGEGEQK